MSETVRSSRDSRLVRLGLGIGWRPELALAIDRRADLGFVEIVAENFDPGRHVPPEIALLLERGVRVVVHGVSLSLGGAEPVDRAGVMRLAELARRFDAPLVSEHIAFVRAGGIEAGHLLPIARTKSSLDALVDNVNRAQELLPVPLALENISALFEWPDAEMDDAAFLNALLDRTGCMLLLDLSNVHANARNLGGDPLALLDTLPLERIAYVHVGGGEEDEQGVYHDTHSHPLSRESLELVEQLARRTDLNGYMIERDDNFAPTDELNAELDALKSAVARGRSSPCD